MRRNEEAISLPQAIARHPATIAWLQLDALHQNPARIEVLRSMSRRKTPIFRLLGAGPDRSAVIAKLASASKAEREHTIYTRVFPLLPNGAFRYYGSIPDGTGSCWLFTEDVGGERISFDNQRHNQLALEWLSGLHVTIPCMDCIPSRDLNYCFARLHRGRDRIGQSLENPALGRQDRMILRAILAHVEELDHRRKSVEDLYHALPQCFIHGDFKKKNIQVRRNGDELALLVFDWEDAGWGCPGIDMWKLDAAAYATCTAPHWPGFDREQAQRLQQLGRLLWCFTAVEWASGWLFHEWVAKAMERFRIYEDLLAESIRDLPFEP